MDIPTNKTKNGEMVVTMNVNVLMHQEDIIDVIVCTYNQ